MKFKEQSQPRENQPKKGYAMKGFVFDRDGILEKAALILEGSPKFPDSRGDKANHLMAKQAIRDVLIKAGAEDYSIEDLEKQISADAYEVLDLFKK